MYKLCKNLHPIQPEMRFVQRPKYLSFVPFNIIKQFLVFGFIII
jgi:hypothetical protein